MDDGRGARAAARGRAAAERAAELKAFRERLERGDHVTERDVADALDAAAASRELKVQATLAAADGHRAAAEAHRRAARTLEQAGDLDKAASHRDRAAVDDAGARRDDESASREAQP